MALVKNIWACGQVLGSYWMLEPNLLEEWGVDIHHLVNGKFVG